MKFILSKLHLVNGARFENGKLIINYDITSKIEGCPYEGKFEQTDNYAELVLPEKGFDPSQLEELIPQLAQQWINEQYPNTK